ncbi:MAG: amidase [Actinobacteria bacterium]|nr:amidase [Actinomycetota bacterium]
MAGTVTTAGCPVVAEVAEPARHDAACVAGFRTAGARIVGKTNLHELCFGATGVNPHYGTPRNPLDPTRVPGGSSSGSAVAVATGQADVALGTDTAGSIRNPAACCGVVGLKTTFGRVPVAGTRPLAPSMDTIGLLAADVSGLADAMVVIESGFGDVHVELSSVRLGRLTITNVDPRIDAAVDSVLARTGADVEAVRLDGWSRAHTDGIDLMYAEALEVNRWIVEAHRDRLGADVRARFDRAAGLSSDHLLRVRERQAQWQVELAIAFEGFDAIVSAGLPEFPRHVHDADPSSNVAAVAVSFAGFPALSLPIPTMLGPTTVAGGSFPASLQVIGRPGSEERLIALGRVLEERGVTWSYPTADKKVVRRGGV